MEPASSFTPSTSPNVCVFSFAFCFRYFKFPSCISSFITHEKTHCWLKNHLFRKSFPLYRDFFLFPLNESVVFWLLPVLLSFFVFFLFLAIIFQFMVQCGRLGPKLSHSAFERTNISYRTDGKAASFGFSDTAFIIWYIRSNFRCLLQSLSPLTPFGYQWFVTLTE